MAQNTLCRLVLVLLTLISQCFYTYRAASVLDRPILVHSPTLPPFSSLHGLKIVQMQG